MREKDSPRFCFAVVVLFVFAFLFPLLSFSQGEGDTATTAKAVEAGGEIPFSLIEEKIQTLMDDADIPGLSLVIIKGDQVYTKGFGFADVEKETPVTPGTLFELASVSKAFTALAVLQLEKDGFVDLDTPVSRYLPWFYVNFEGKKQPVTLRQLLHHSSGLPTRSIAKIPLGGAEDALEQTVRGIVGYELVCRPGTRFEYATINYDILGAVIASVSGMTYENYMGKHIFNLLEMRNTSVGRSPEKPGVAAGYKIGFFSARKYDAPIYRGNNPAGYVLTNGEDMVRWLKAQMGLSENPLAEIIPGTHQPDRSVAVNRQTLGSYCMGWFSYLTGDDVLDHSGQNPNFASYVAFSQKEGTGVALMANSNSVAITAIGHYVMGMARGMKQSLPSVTGDPIDKGSAVITFMVGLYLLSVIGYFVFLFLDILKGNRRFEGLTLKKLGKWILALMVYIPFIYGVYLIPGALNGVSWAVALVWAPVSFKVTVIFLLASMGFSWIGLVFSGFFPQQNKYKRQVPLMIALSLASGGANAVIIFLITGSVFAAEGLSYQLYFFTLAFLLYILGRKVLQTELIVITFDIIYDLRMNLVEKIFNTTYQKFERIERGRVLATLNDDTNQISQAANIVVMLITSIITIIGGFVYLATLAFWATAITLLVVLFVAGLYYVVTERSNVLFEQARDTQNAFMGILDGLLDGFKELSMHYNKRSEYKKDVSNIVDEFRAKLRIAFIKFVNAFLIGESLLIIILGAVGFGIPRIFPDISPLTIMSFIMVLLYLIGPFNALLRAMPMIMQMRVSWIRIQTFGRDIPANIDPSEIKPPAELPDAIDSIEAKGIMFEYQGENELERFRVGPLDFNAQKGEIIFIIGGNGSGKTTLAKLITGLYVPDNGSLKINGEEKNNYQIGEYFSTVFSDYHLFEKLYNVDLTGKEKQIQEYLKLLRLEEKVTLEGNSFSTTGLSGGQRKRLALLQCYLEEHPIYLFDEIAADQDPEFRRFFYRNLLQRMKEEGKIVIAITHDDHYFDVADRVVKMDFGKIETVGADYKTTSA